MLFGGATGAEVLRLLDDRQRAVDFARTPYGGGDEDYPFTYPEQDVLNAILSTRADPGASSRSIAGLLRRRRTGELRAKDVDTLRCAYPDGAEPYVLHQYVRKPWLERMYHGIYSQLLSRLLLGDDVALQVPEDTVPLRLRSGPRARADRALADAVDLTRWYVTEVVPRRLRELRCRLAGRGHTMSRLLHRRRRALLPRRRGDDQLAARRRPRRAGVRARLRLDRRAAPAAHAPRDIGRGAPRRSAVAAEDDRPAFPPRRGDGADRRRHRRHAFAFAS